MRAVGDYLTAKHYVGRPFSKKVDEPKLVRSHQVDTFFDFKLTNVNSITLNTQTVNDNQVFTISYEDQFLEENERSRRDLGIDFHIDSGDLVKNNQE